MNLFNVISNRNHGCPPHLGVLRRAASPVHEGERRMTIHTLLEAAVDPLYCG